MTLTKSPDAKAVEDVPSEPDKATDTFTAQGAVKTDAAKPSTAPEKAMTAEAGLRDLERTLARALDDDLGSEIEANGLARPSATPAETAPEPPFLRSGAASKPAEPPAEKSVAPAPVKTVSGRALELQRKKAAANAMRDKLRQGSELFNNLLGSHDAFIAYLAKTEQELAQLERTERHAEQTQALVEDMLREQKKLTGKYKEQVKQIELLEATKNRYRTAIESARGEIDRFKQLIGELRHDGETKAVSITILEDAKSELTEANQGLEAENRKHAETLKAHVARIEQLETEASALKVSLDEASRVRDELMAEKDKALVDLNDMSVRLQGVSGSHAELKSMLDEKTFEMEARSKTHEQAIASRDARIKELEAELIAEKKASAKDTKKGEADPLVRLGLTSLAAKASELSARDRERAQPTAAKSAEPSAREKGRPRPTSAKTDGPPARAKERSRQAAAKTKAA